MTSTEAQYIQRNLILNFKSGFYLNEPHNTYCPKPVKLFFLLPLQGADFWDWVVTGLDSTLTNWYGKYPFQDTPVALFSNFVSN